MPARYTNMRPFIFTLCALCAAYRRIPCLPFKESTTFLVSPDFSAEMSAELNSAASAWNNALGRNALILVEGAERAGANHIYPSAATGGSTAHVMRYGGSEHGWSLSSDVALSASLSGAAAYNVALHEFGHVLGLEHSPSSLIMGYTLRVDEAGAALPDVRRPVTFDDIAGVWFHH